jgi:hypothetical protein
VFGAVARQQPFATMVGKMPQFTPVSRERHAGKKWQRLKGYRFASAITVAPIVGAELGRAALAMPLAFLQEADRFVLVAVLSLTAGRNMLVAPDGRWLSGYIPALFQTYPFCLLPKQGSDQVVLCVDADSGLVVEGETAGEDFFDQQGNLSPALKKVFNFLGELERGRKATDVAVSTLAAAGIIKPWPIKIKTEQGDRAMTGLHHIDAAALNALADDAFLKLRKSSALSVAYAQMLSAGQLGLFEQLARLQAKLTPPPVAALPENLDSLFGLSSDDIIQFR